MNILNNKFIFISVILVTMALSIIFVSYSISRSKIIEGIEGDPERTVIRTQLGSLEVAIVGEGIPILMLHGGPGGYDQSLVGIRSGLFDIQQAAKTIAVSRPGYLGTPLESGETFEEQADLFVSLLDELNIDKAIVYATSAGGGPGIQFAINHPERMIALILQSVRIGPRPGNQNLNGTQNEIVMFFEDMIFWIARYFPTLWIDNFDSSDPKQTNAAELVIASTIPQNRRIIGSRNDRKQYSNIVVSELPFENILVPTLVIHGDEDNLVPYTNAEILSNRIPNARLVTIEGGDHFLSIGHSSEFNSEIGKFIGEVLTSE